MCHVQGAACVHNVRMRVECLSAQVYTFGPTFRAEHSMTTRHLAEFWMIEPEVAFCDRDGCMDLAEAYVRHCIKYVLDTCPEDMKLLDSGSKIFTVSRASCVCACVCVCVCARA